MRTLVFFTLVLILVPIAMGKKRKHHWMEPEPEPDAHGKDDNVLGIADEPDDPKMPEEELHLTNEEKAEAKDPGAVAKVEIEDIQDEAGEKQLVAEAQYELEQDRKDQAEGEKEAAWEKLTALEKEARTKMREQRHEEYEDRHEKRLEKLMKWIDARVERHQKVLHHKNRKG